MMNCNKRRCSQQAINGVLASRALVLVVYYSLGIWGWGSATADAPGRGGLAEHHDRALGPWVVIPLRLLSLGNPAYVEHR